MRTIVFCSVVLLAAGILCCAATSAVAMSAQAAGAIAGFVYDSETESGIGGARVEAYACDSEALAGVAVTIGDGSYRLEALSGGCYLLRFDADGYESSWYGEPYVKAKATRVYLAGEPVVDIDTPISPASALITGRVVDGAGKPLSGVWATAFLVDSENLSISDARTDADGQFVIETGSGLYIVVYEKKGYVATIYGGSITEPVKLEISPGDVKTKIDAEMVLGGRISGTVRDGHGEGLDEIMVVAQGGAFPVTGRSYRDGRYVVDGLPAGSYTLVFVDENRAYQMHWYGSGLSPEGSTSVALAGLEEISGIDVVLSAAGGISGWVTDSAGSGVADVTVIASPVDRRGIGGYGVSDEKGAYTVSGLPTGKYMVMFQSAESPMQPVIYPGVEHPSRAEQVAVAAPQVTAGIDVVLAKGSSVFGLVTGPFDEPLEKVFVSFYPKDGSNVIGYGNTDEEGKYTAALQPGEYVARFEGVEESKKYLAQWSGGVAERKDADLVLVAEASGIRLDMTLPLGGSIAGAVSNRAGGRLPGIKVNAYDQESGKRLGTATSDENGYYRIVGLGSGHYSVVAIGEESGYVKQKWPQPVEVVASKETPQINMVLTEGGAISGKVSDESGKPIRGVDVDVFDPVTWREIADTETDENGVYTLGGLPVDNYSVRFDKRDYIVQWYAGKNRRENSNRVAVVDTSTRSGYDVVLKKGVPLSGIVTDSTGFPVSRAEVGIYADIDDEPIEEVHTGFDGRYSVKNLAPGSYRIRFGTEDHMPRWYGGRHRTEASSLDVGTAGFDGLDISLELSVHRVSGKLINAAGEDVGQAWMSVVDANTGQPVSDERICECSGKFKIPVPQGKYKLRVERFGKTYWYGGDSLETAKVLNVDGDVRDLRMVIQ